MPIRYFDMFAGIGGFRSGLEAVGGFECVGYCEIDPYARKAYKALYDTRGEKFYEDATKIIPEQLPDFDLICGGFPCQSFSIAGKRRGFDDVRGTMFFEIARIAAVKRPRYLLLENVPGLLSHDEGRTFAAILTALDDLGYDVAWQVLNSANFGVAQARKRVFIVGFLRAECAGRILSFTDANPKTLIQRIPGKEGCRVYSPEGLSITLTGTAGGFGGKSGLYEILGLPIKSLTKSGYQIAVPGDSIDLAYADMNSRRGRVGHDIAHTVTPSATQGFYSVKCIDMNPEPQITDLARCITAR
jgi:DNA (cytosine-5)-methyltransferase 1